MPTMTALPADDPIMKAWERYKKTEGFENTLKWASRHDLSEGSLWAAFLEGWQAAMQTPANTVEVKASQVLSRDECEAIWRAIAYLHVLEAGADARNEQLLVHYVQQAIAGLVRLIRPENSD